MNNIAKWADGFRMSANAQKVADELAALGEVVNPQDIVNAARDEASELHKCFTWDDTTAAEKWRIQEARQIVCHLVFVPAETPKKEPIRIYYHSDVSGGYKQLATIVRNDDEYRQMLKRALGELKSFQRKYRALSDKKELIALIEAVELMATT